MPFSGFGLSTTSQTTTLYKHRDVEVRAGEIAAWELLQREVIYILTIFFYIRLSCKALCSTCDLKAVKCKEKGKPV